MCGIVGYVGRKPACAVLLHGLHALEYRGYDSAGVALQSNGKISICKTKGRVSALEEKLKEHPLYGTTGIGHTRWATHGEPSDVNAHPHSSMAGDIAVVHNGIIENYMELKRWLIEQGCVFHSDTDTEVVAHLVAHFYEGSLEKALLKTVQRIRGSYALAVLSEKEPGRIVCTRQDSPLVIGLGKGENFLASDITALLRYTRDVYLLEEGAVAVVEEDSVRLMNRMGEPVEQEVFHVDWDVAAAEKGGYAHFMLKEIYEEPQALRDTIAPRIKEGHIRFEGLADSLLKEASRIVICACGTAYHAGLVGKYAIEKLARVPVEVDIASEYRNREPIIRPDDLFIVVSQSGETADTIAGMRTFRAGGGKKVIAITNAVGSTVAREADVVLYTWAGPEIAVASTKAYTTQLAVLTMLAMEMGRLRGTLSLERYETMLNGLMEIPQKAQEVLGGCEAIQKAASLHFNEHDVFFMGRGFDYPATMESSLKLKEISYIHSEALAAGELKHGTIALIEKDMLVVAVSTQQPLVEKLVSNIKEVKARGAHVLALSYGDNTAIREQADEFLPVPAVDDLLAPMVSIIPAQLFAYYCAILRGFDPDKPRNLAKSVTVE